MVEILGVPFSTLSFAETVEQLEQAMQGGAAMHVITAAPELIMMALENDDFKRLMLQADLITPDGIGAVWASQYYGHKLRERVTGMELSTALIEFAAKQGLSVYLLGAKPESNALALKNLRAKYPDLRIVGRDGYFKSEEEAEIVEEIRSFRPALLLVGLGQPRQELFLHDHKSRLNANVMIGIGGCIDIFAGTVKRAPKLWQKMRLEWLYRLLSQPSRWRRQLVLPRFVLTVLKDPNKGKGKAANS